MKRMITVGDLRKIISGVNDDVQVLVPASDHSYSECSAKVGTALYDRKLRMWTEDFGEDDTPEAEYGKRMTVLIVE